jgi:hypothetical protein
MKLSDATLWLLIERHGASRMRVSGGDHFGVTRAVALVSGDRNAECRGDAQSLGAHRGTEPVGAAD